MKMKIVLTLLWLCLFLIAVKFAKILQFATNLQDFTTLISGFTVAFKASVLACCWVFVLTDNDMILGWFRRLCFSLVDWYAWDGKTLNPTKRANAEYLFKPVLTCERCTTGNFAFWVYVLSSRGNIVILEVLFIISLSIFITVLTAKLWQTK